MYPLYANGTVAGTHKEDLVYSPHKHYWNSWTNLWGADTSRYDDYATYKETLYFGTDALGSVRTTSSYSVFDFGSINYDVFGSPYRRAGSFLNTESLDFGYLGKPYNATTELYDYGFRDYSPRNARFTTVDPIRDGRNWYTYVLNDPVNYVDLWGLSRDNDQTTGNLSDEYNSSLINIMTKYLLNKPYLTGGTSIKGIDCSGLLITSLRMMGFAVSRETTATLSSGKVEWLSINKELQSEGELGIINFYKTGGAKSINHMSIGIGYSNIPLPVNPKEKMKQIINANEDDSLLVRNDGRNGQYYEAKSSSINQTYAPLSTNTPVVLQATINWDILKEKYFDVGLAEDGYWGD